MNRPAAPTCAAGGSQHDGPFTPCPPTTKPSAPASASTAASASAAEPPAAKPCPFDLTNTMTQEQAEILGLCPECGSPTPQHMNSCSQGDTSGGSSCSAAGQQQGHGPSASKGDGKCKGKKHKGDGKCKGKEHKGKGKDHQGKGNGKWKGKGHGKGKSGYGQGRRQGHYEWDVQSGQWVWVGRNKGTRRPEWGP